MDKVVQQKPSKWFPSLRIITVVGYFVLMIAIKLTGQMAGYSNDTTLHLIDHLLATSLMLLPGSVLAWGLIGKSVLARWSRRDMDKSHLGGFVLAALLGGVGMVVMAQHGSPAIQDNCFYGVALMIVWSLGLEYMFVAYRKPAP